MTSTSIHQRNFGHMLEIRRERPLEYSGYIRPTRDPFAHELLIRRKLLICRLAQLASIDLQTRHSDFRHLASRSELFEVFSSQGVCSSWPPLISDFVSGNSSFALGNDVIENRRKRRDPLRQERRACQQPSMHRADTLRTQRGSGGPMVKA